MFYPTTTSDTCIHSSNEWSTSHTNDGGLSLFFSERELYNKMLGLLSTHLQEVNAISTRSNMQFEKYAVWKIMTHETLQFGLKSFHFVVQTEVFQQRALMFFTSLSAKSEPASKQSEARVKRIKGRRGPKAESCCRSDKLAEEADSDVKDKIQKETAGFFLFLPQQRGPRPFVRAGQTRRS